MTRIRSVPAALLVAASLALAACASDDAGVRALNETTTLRAQLDDMRQRQDVSTREITRLQSQVRALETDAVDKTRDVKAANVALARGASGATDGDGPVGPGAAERAGYEPGGSDPTRDTRAGTRSNRATTR